MSDADRAKWDERYRAADPTGDPPSAFLREWEPRLPYGRVLDVACGSGRNSIYLAATGHLVDAIDISPAGLAQGHTAATAQGLTINWLEADLEPDPDMSLPRGPYELIIMIRYVNPALLPLLLERLTPGGALAIEEHVDSSEDVSGPRNPAFRLRSNELLEQVFAIRQPGDTVRYYHEGIVTSADGTRTALAQLVLDRNPLPS